MARTMVLRSWVSFGLTVVGLSLVQACSAHVVGEDDGAGVAGPVTEGDGPAAAADSGGKVTNALGIEYQERRTEFLHEAADVGGLERIDETGANSAWHDVLLEKRDGVTRAQVQFCYIPGA